MIKYLLLPFLAIASILPAFAAVEPGQEAPEFTLTDSKGTSHKLSDFRGKLVVLEWLNHECPFVKKHYSGGDMQKLQQEYTAKGVVWLSIISSAPGKQGHRTGHALRKIAQTTLQSLTEFESHGRCTHCVGS